MTATVTARTRTPVSPWVILGVLSAGLFMSLLDTTIVNVAMPSIIDGLRASFDQVLWMLNAYTLVYCVLLITAGRLGDIIGPRTMFAVGVSVFTLASAACGLAQTPLQLIGLRALQGVGGAMLAPQALPFITSLFPAEKRAVPFAVTGMLGGLAVVAGPIVGGALVTHVGWRAIFFLNVPIGVTALLLTLRLVPDLRPGRGHRLNLAEVTLVTGALLAITFGLIEGERYHWGAFAAGISIPEVIAVGVVLLGAFVLTQLRGRGETLLPVALFRDRNVSICALLLSALSFAMLGLFLPLTIYLQSVLGLSAITAGLTVAAMSLTMMALSGPVNGLVPRFGAKRTLLVCLPLFTIGMAWLVFDLSTAATPWSLAPPLVLAGAGLAGTWGPLFAIGVRDVPPRLAGTASGAFSTIQELGGVIASAAVGAVLQAQLAASLHSRAVAAATTLPSSARAGFVGSFTGAASTGFSVGAGQTGASVTLPGVPAPVAAHIAAAARLVFTHGFVDAMRPAMLLPIALLVVGIIAVTRLRDDRLAGASAEAETSRPLAEPLEVAV